MFLISSNDFVKMYSSYIFVYFFCLKFKTMFETLLQSV
jgi:hypothetical protein